MTSRKHVGVDQHGRAVGFRHHDGYLDAIVCDRAQRSVVLGLRDVDGGGVLLHFDDVRWMTMTGLELGNIVHTIWVHDRDQLVGDPAHLARIAATHGDEARDASERKLGDWRVVTLEFSTRAAGLIVAREVTWQVGAGVVRLSIVEERHGQG